MKSTKVAELKASSLLSIGRLCRKMGAHLSYRIDDLVEVLSSVLLTKMKMRGVPSEALKCISDMVCGMGKYLWGFSTCNFTLTYHFVSGRCFISLPSVGPARRHAALRSHRRSHWGSQCNYFQYADA
jgi:hypothetical protein